MPLCHCAAVACVLCLSLHSGSEHLIGRSKSCKTRLGAGAEIEIDHSALPHARSSVLTEFALHVYVMHAAGAGPDGHAASSKISGQHAALYVMKGEALIEDRSRYGGRPGGSNAVPRLGHRLHT